MAGDGYTELSISSQYCYAVYSGNLLCGVLLNGISCYLEHDFVPILLHLCYILLWLCGSMAMWNKFSMPEHIRDNRFPLYILGVKVSQYCTQYFELGINRCESHSDIWCFNISYQWWANINWPTISQQTNIEPTWSWADLYDLYL